MTLFRNAMIYDRATRMFRRADMLEKDGVILAVGSFPAPDGAEVVDLTGAYLVPGLVDVHTHGRSGFDFNTAPEDAYGTMMRDYALAGTTSVMPTLASDTFPHLIASAEAIRRQTGASRGKASFIGLHLEGRYLSPVRRGAHAAELLANPDAAEFDDLRKAYPDAPLHVSLAPELPGADDYIRRAVDGGATVGVAHSDADFETAEHAVSLGASSFTHTFNAMRPVHHREPGDAIAALLTDSAYAEFIADGEHLHPAMLRLAVKTKSADKLVLITDSMEATGMPDGQYAIAGQPVVVKNGRATSPDGKLAGSTLTLFRAVCNVMKFCSLPLETVIPFATSNPAEMVGAGDVCGSLEIGKRCDFLVLRDKYEPVLEAVYAGGIPVV